MIFEFEPDVFNPAFLPYLEAPQKIHLFTGNRGSGKSIFLYQRAVVFALSKKYFRMLYARKVADTIRKSTFQGLKDVIVEWGLQDHFRILEGSMDIHCRFNGNMMISHGLDKPEKLKSIKDVSHVLFDEMTESTFEDYAQLEALLRTEKANTQFWGAFNPEHGFWGRQYFFLDHESDTIPLGEVPAKTADTLIFKASFKDNPFIDAVAYEKKLKELAGGDENYHTVWVDGDWGQSVTGGEFYHGYKRSVHMGDVPFFPGVPVHLTFDFNVLPYMTMLAAQISRFKAFYDPADHSLADRKTDKNTLVSVFQVRIFREYCLKDPLNSTEACISAFLDDFGHHKPDVFFYGDAMGNKRHEGTGNKTEFKKVKDMLARYIDPQQSDRSCRVNPSVLQRRKFVNKILLQMQVADGVVIQLVIDKSCVETHKDFQHTKLGVEGKLKERYKDPKTKQSYELLGHTSDAVDYLLTKAFETYFKAQSG